MEALRKDVTVESLNEGQRDSLAGLMGLEVVSLEEKKLTGRMKITKEHVAVNGFLYAASIIALADTSCGNAAIAHLPEGAENLTTIELKSNHVGTVREGTLLCVATAQHLGKMTQVWDAVVTEETTGKTIALFRCTQMVLWPKDKK